MNNLKCLNMNCGHNTSAIGAIMIFRKHVFRFKKLQETWGSFGRRLSDYFGGLVENSSIHGLCYLIKTGHSKFRIVWILGIIFSVFAASVLVVRLWQRYSSQPFFYLLQTAYGPSADFEFPAITVCDMSPNKKRINELLTQLNYTHSIAPEDIKGGFKVMMKAFEKIHVQTALGKELDDLHSILHYNGLSVSDAIARISTPCSDMLLHCKWENDQYPCSELFKSTKTGFGFCCSFNLKTDSDFVLRRSSTFGLGSGLGLILRQTGRVRVAIHSPHQIPYEVGGHAPYFTRPFADQITFLSYEIVSYTHSSSIVSLPIEGRGCVIEGEIKLRYSKDYAIVNCMIECMTNASLALCGCAPYTYPIDREHECRISDIECLNGHEDIIFSPRLTTTDRFAVKDDFIEEVNDKDLVDMCKCWNECEYVQYISDGLHFPLDAIQATSDDFFGNFHANRSESVVLVYNSRQSVKIWMKELAKNSISLICSLGGVFGLCFGGSIISVLELIYYCVISMMKRYWEYLKELNRNKIEIIFGRP